MINGPADNDEAVADLDEDTSDDTGDHDPGQVG
jgi:hypothetical protein